MCGGMGGGGVLLLFNDDGDGADETGDDCCVCCCCCCCCCLMMEGLRVVLRCCCCCWLDILILSVTSQASSDLLVRPKVDLSDACVVVDDFLFVFAVGCFLLLGWDDIFSVRFAVWNGSSISLPVPEMGDDKPRR